MSCMEHECTSRTCDWWEGNNETSVLGGCPKCGSAVISTWDEEPDRDDDDERADEEEEE